MFFRQKTVGSYTYLQIVENRWEDGKSKQRVLANLGRLDHLQQEGRLASLLESGSRFSEALMVVSAHAKGEAPVVSTKRIGAALVFERLWRETGCQQVITTLLEGRKFEFAVERAIFLEVLHRLVQPGSDRSCYHWRGAYQVPGAEGLDLHHAYRAMAWLGEELGSGAQEGRTPFSPRCTKDSIEEKLFQRRRDLFSGLEMVFFDTTSLYFEGNGGVDLGRRGHSKDHRPDLRQMVVGAVLDEEGVPVCCELWPGNTADVGTLLPLAERFKKRFGIDRVCLVADRGMIKKKTLDELESRKWPYILGVRMRSTKEARDEVMSRGGRYRVVDPERRHPGDPSPLKVKEVWVEDRRYIVCLNEEQARKDRADREAIVAALQDQLPHRSGKSLVGNKGYARYLKTVPRGAFAVDEDRIRDDARYDGKWVLRTNTDFSADEVALSYKQLWMVEELFRSLKSLLATRPIYHKTDATIRGHVFCSFLAMLLRRELQERMWRREESNAVEWDQAIRDLERVEEIEVQHRGKTFLLRTELPGDAGKVFRAAGVRIPKTVRHAA
jgi:hypothetical protein